LVALDEGVAEVADGASVPAVATVVVVGRSVDALASATALEYVAAGATSPTVVLIGLQARAGAATARVRR
jgi:hypothetical protein